jgi:hypothetical protein
MWLFCSWEQSEKHPTLYLNFRELRWVGGKSKEAQPSYTKNITLLSLRWASLDHNFLRSSLENIAFCLQLNGKFSYYMFYILQCLCGAQGNLETLARGLLISVPWLSMTVSEWKTTQHILILGVLRYGIWLLSITAVIYSWFRSGLGNTDPRS